MTHLLILLLFNSLFIFGLNFVCGVSYGDGSGYNPIIKNRELLWFISEYGTKWFGYNAMKPLTLCVMCMASVWGTLFYWLYIGYQLNATNLIIWPAYCIALCGLNRIISRWV